MLRLILIFALASSVLLAGQHTGANASPAVEKHISALLSELPAESLLRSELLAGARGDGIREPWMNEMRTAGVRRVMVWVRITYSDSGRPKRLEVDHVQYFDDYGGENEITNPDRLKSLRSSSLEKKLTIVGLDRARRGSWLDVPRPRPQPFAGGTSIELLDDEWLPVFKRPIYCAGPACIPRSAKRK